MSDDLLERLVDWDEYDEGKLNDMREEAKARIEALTAERDRLREALNQCRLAFSGYVSVQSAIDLIDGVSLKDAKNEN